MHKVCLPVGKVHKERNNTFFVFFVKNHRVLCGLYSFGMFCLHSLL